MVKLYAMAIEKYTTEAFILEMYERGEDDIVIKTYTRDFGLIFIRSASLRKSVKMRGHIQKGKLSSVTIVQGKEMYRLTGVTEIINSDKFINVISECLLRFVHGEGKNTKLFDRLMSYIDKTKSFDLHQLRICLYVDVLITLGYIDIEDLFESKEEYLKKSVDDMYIESQLKKKDFVNSIQKAIKESML